jgi:hypothetical protein
VPKCDCPSEILKSERKKADSEPYKTVKRPLEIGLDPFGATDTMY